MAISSTTRKAGPYLSDGEQLSYSFDFKVFTAQDLRIVKADTNGAETDLILDTDYSVTLNEDQENDAGGTITLIEALTENYTLIITSNIELTQDLALQNSGNFSPTVINNALDKIVIQLQQVNEKADRAVKSPITSEDDPDEIVNTLLQAKTDAVNAANSAESARDTSLEIVGSLENLEQAVIDAESAAEQTALDVISTSNSAGIATSAAAIAETVSMFTTNRTAVKYATTAALPSHTYNNGAGTITFSATGAWSPDGTTAALNDDIAVQFESTNPERNGIYRVTTAGASGVATVLTRRSTENNAAGLGGACVTVQSGTVYAGWTLKVQQASGNITLGTTAITFSRQTQQGAYATALGVSNSITNVGYSTLTQRGVCSFAATAASGYNYMRILLAVTVPNGGKLTVFYQSDVDASASSPRVELFRSGFGVVSNKGVLTLDGQLRSVVLTATNDAPELAFESNGAASNFAIRYVAVQGDLAETVPSRSALVSTIMSLMDIMSQPQKDLTLRGEGVMTGATANTSMDTFTVNGYGDYTFVEASGSASYARTTLSTITSGKAVTVLYRVVPVDGSVPLTGSVQLQLERLGFGSASTNYTLVSNGLPQILTLTSTQQADRLLWTATNANLRVIFTVFNGGLTDATPSSTQLQASLIAALNATRAPVCAETWTTDDKLILFPTPVAFVSNRNVTFYGRQMTKGRIRQQLQADISIFSSPSESGDGIPYNRTLRPDLVLTGNDLQSTFVIEVRDPDFPALVNRRTITRYLANNTQTGTVLFCMLGDSTAALGLTALKSRVEARGCTFTGVGTRTSGGISYEGRSGWDALNYLGKRRPSGTANPFLRSLSVSVPAELAIITANPTVCFADDVSYGTGTRPSYAEDSSKASYSIFSWDYWRQDVAVNLAASVKLRVCMQLGRNGTSSATWLTDNDLAQNWIVEDFRNTFANGTMFVASEAVGEATDTVNSATVPQTYRDRTRELIAKKIQWFSNREAQRVWLIPSWCMQNAYAGFNVNTATSTDTATGTATHTVSDVVHYSGVLAIQWAESVLGALLYVHQTT